MKSVDVFENKNNQDNKQKENMERKAFDPAVNSDSFSSGFFIPRPTSDAEPTDRKHHGNFHEDPYNRWLVQLLRPGPNKRDRNRHRQFEEIAGPDERAGVQRPLCGTRSIRIEQIG